MKAIKTITNISLAAILFTACQKDMNAVKPATSINSTTDEIATYDEVSSQYDAPTGTTKLVLRPGPKKGQDTWIEYMPSDTTRANDNSGVVDQFKVLAWTIDGAPVYDRALIRFDSLARVPAGKEIVSAKLYLYGLSSSPVVLPQGNSTYPGSPYNAYGTNVTLVQKVTSAWNENTVTWNTQPNTTDVGEDVIPQSTSQWNYDAKVDVTNLVKNMLVSNGDANYGFMLRLADESVYKSMGFYTSEASDKTKRPKLVVTYR